MTKRLQVLFAVKALIEAALPNVTVLGLENSGAAPDRIPPEGRVVIRAGDPGEPEIDLSPVVYNYQHQIPVEITVRKDGPISAEEALDDTVGLISAAVAANRTCGGAVDYLDGFSPATDDLFTPGSEIARTADLVLVATYSTTDPL